MTTLLCLAASLGVVGVYLLWLAPLDPVEPEPLRLRGLCLAWGACVAAPAAYWLNGWVPETEAAVAAPLIEEACKGLGLMLPLTVAREEWDAVVDGVVYGVLIGLGFALVENTVYLVEAVDTGGQAAFWTELWARAVLGTVAGHATYTALTGALLGAALSKDGRSVPAWALAGWTLAVAAHMAWNMGWRGVMHALVVGSTMLDLLVAAVVLHGPFVMLLWVIWRRSFRDETARMHRVLSATLGQDVAHWVAQQDSPSGKARDAHTVLVEFAVSRRGRHEVISPDVRSAVHWVRAQEAAVSSSAPG